jgi:hypothetical protein
MTKIIPFPTPAAPAEPRRYGGLTLTQARALLVAAADTRSSGDGNAIAARLGELMIVLGDALDAVRELEGDVDTLRALDEEAKHGADEVQRQLREARAELAQLRPLAAAVARLASSGGDVCVTLEQGGRIFIADRVLSLGEPIPDDARWKVYGGPIADPRQSVDRGRFPTLHAAIEGLAGEVRRG